MSRIDVDDLVATFKSQAIGQDAMDLVLLQKQLAQALRPCNSPGSKLSAAHASPIQTSFLHQQFATQQSSGYCGAPSSSYSSSQQQQQYATMNSPTSAFHPNGGPMVGSSPAYYYSSLSMGDHTGAGSPVAMSARSRSASRGRTATRRVRSNSSVSGYDNNVDWEEMQEVEEDLDDGVPASEHYNYYGQAMQQHCFEQQQRFQTYPAGSPAAASGHPQQQPSSFASSDPFYLATAAAAASTSASQTPSTPTFSSNGGTAITKGAIRFAPPVGFAAYAPAGNRWTSTATTASAVQ